LFLHSRYQISFWAWLVQFAFMTHLLDFCSF
jgi:hypothetical protein